MEEYKQVIVVRKDLKLSRGKMCSQVAHASLDSYRKADGKTRSAWESSGAKKVVVGVGSLKELLDIKERAGELGIPCSLVRDAGRTHVPPGTVTCLGIGPGREGKIDKLTKELKLIG